MRLILGTWLAITVGIFSFAAGAGLTASLSIAAAIGIVAAAVTAFVIHKFSILNLSVEASSTGLKVLSTFAVLAALLQLARLTIFMVEPSRTEYSTLPFSNWEIRHSCLTAYFVADRSVGRVPDIYATSLYTMPNDDPKSMRKPRMLGPFNIDVYEYPPPFLLLTRATSFLAPDFYRHRSIWFCMNGMIVLIGVIVVARSLGPLAGTRAMLFAPFLFASMPTLNTLQKGNIQLTIIALAIIAMVLLNKQRLYSGGLLLAYATIGKIYPGMLLVYLIVKRQWRAVLVTAGFGIVLALLALSVTGGAAYNAFLTHLPAVLGGEAFPAFRNPSATAINLSIPGVIFKLKLFGVPGMTFGISKVVGWIYTLILLAVIMIVARRPVQSENEMPIVWMAILILATLRSPFLPQSYGNVPAIWLLTLLAAIREPNRNTLLLFILGWLPLNVMVPHDLGVDPRKLALINLLPQAATIAVAILGLMETTAASHPANAKAQTLRTGAVGK